MQRENGVFRDEDGFIPEGNIVSLKKKPGNCLKKLITIGQSKCVYALEECYKLIQELSDDSSEDEEGTNREEEEEEEEEREGTEEEYSYTEGESYTEGSSYYELKEEQKV